MNSLKAFLIALSLSIVLISCRSSSETYPGTAPNPTYSVTYDGNGSTGGTIPIDSTSYEQGQTVIALANTGNLVKTGFVFSGWNTQTDGLGTNYLHTQEFTISANVTLYAKWIAASRYTYVANQDSNSVSQYTINTDGSLTSMTTPTVATGLAPYCVAAHPSGNYVYVANAGDSTISQYTISADGSLISMTTPTVVSAGPTSIAIDRAGKYVYAASFAANNISQYTINSDGSLTPMTLATVAAGWGPMTVTIDPSGRYVYTANFMDETISQYRIGADGSLIPMTTPTVAAGPTPWSITVSPSGKSVYVTNEGNGNVNGTISQFTIGADGSLTSMATPTVVAGLSPISITVDPTRKYAYVANLSGNNVSQYTISADGSLTPMATATVNSGAPFSITVDSLGKYAYVASWVGYVYQYTIGADGSLASMATPAIAAEAGANSIVTVGAHD